MDNTQSTVPSWCKALILVLMALLIVLLCVILEANSSKKDLENQLQSICSSAMLDMEMELRSSDPELQKSLYQFYTITQAYPGTSYAYLARELLVLEDPQVQKGLTAADRRFIADGLQAYRLEDQAEYRSDYLTGIGNILARVTMQKEA